MRFLLYYTLAVCITAAEIKAVTKKVAPAASLPAMPGETPLFVGDRCRYVGRDATL